MVFCVLPVLAHDERKIFRVEAGKDAHAICPCRERDRSYQHSFLLVHLDNIDLVDAQEKQLVIDLLKSYQLHSDCFLDASYVLNRLLFRLLMIHLIAI